MLSKLLLVNGVLHGAHDVADQFAAYSRAHSQGAYAVCRDWCLRASLVFRTQGRLGLA